MIKVSDSDEYSLYTGNVHVDRRASPFTMTH